MEEREKRRVRERKTGPAGNGRKRQISGRREKEIQI